MTVATIHTANIWCSMLWF